MSSTGDLSYRRYWRTEILEHVDNLVEDLTVFVIIHFIVKICGLHGIFCCTRCVFSRLSALKDPLTKAPYTR